MKALKFCLPFFVIVLAVSCKKGSSSPATNSFSIKATVDGSEQTFDVSAKAELDSSGGFYRIIITGQQAEGWMSIPAVKLETAPSRNRFTTGTYTNSGNNIEAILQWQLTDSNPVYQSDETGNGSSDATIVITALNSTNVTGTFHGTLLLESGTGPATKVITKGEFNVPVQ